MQGAVLSLGFFLVAVSAAVHKLPESYPLCKRADPDFDKCLIASLETVLPLLRDGLPKLGAVSMDPFNIPAVEINQGTGNINLNIKFANVIVTGLTKGEVVDAHGDIDHYSLWAVGKEPFVLFEADYEMKGKFLVLPVEGQGKCSFKFTNMIANLSLNGESLTKDNKEYMNVKTFITNITSLELLEAHFENLFNGDKTLGDGFNRLLGENWKEFWEALRPSFEETFSVLFLDYSRKIFSNVPMDDIFLPK